MVTAGVVDSTTTREGWSVVAAGTGTVEADAPEQAASRPTNRSPAKKHARRRSFNFVSSAD